MKNSLALFVLLFSFEIFIANRDFQNDLIIGWGVSNATEVLSVESEMTYKEAVEVIQEEQARLSPLIVSERHNFQFYNHESAMRCSIVIFHGMYGSPRDVIGLSRYFYNRGCNVIAPLTPGHWRKDPDAIKNRTENDWVKYIDETIIPVARALGSKVYLVGHSMGGLMAFYAALNNRHIEKMALLTPAFKPTFKAALGLFLYNLFGEDRASKQPDASEYDRQPKPAIVGLYINRLQKRVFGNTFQKTRFNAIPSTLIFTVDSEQIIDNSFIKVVSKANREKIELVQYHFDKDSPIYHDNIERSEWDIDPGDPQSWKNPIFEEMANKIGSFFSLDSL